MNILVVDNEPIITQGIVKRIDSWNLHTKTVGVYSSEQALETMEFFMPDLLIADIEMPHINGLDLISIALEKGYCQKFIIISAYELFEYARQAIQYNVIDYIVKPVDWTVLEKHIRGFVQQPRMQEQFQKATAQCDVLKDIATTGISPSLHKITAYLDMHYASDISLKQLAEMSDMSTNYICSLFKKELNLTYLDYVYHLRLQQAVKLLLAEPDKTMKEISRHIGYHSERQFFRMFRSTTGMTPQQFRDYYAS